MSEKVYARNVEALKNGTVIDHIPAGMGLRILDLFELTRYGERQGLIMLGATDGIMEVLNSPEFAPREF